MPSATTGHTIEKLQVIFSQFGLPEVATDNGPKLVSEDFRSLRGNAILHTASNGLAERAVQTVKKFSRKQLLENRLPGDKRSIQLKIPNFLFRYRTAPHVVTGNTPAELFLGRLPRTRLVFLKPGFVNARRGKQHEAKKRVEEQARTMEFNVEDKVRVRNVRAERVGWAIGKVTKKISALTFKVRVAVKIRFVYGEHLRPRALNGFDAGRNSPVDKGGQKRIQITRIRILGTTPIVLTTKNLLFPVVL